MELDVATPSGNGALSAKYKFSTININSIIIIPTIKHGAVTFMYIERGIPISATRGVTTTNQEITISVVFERLIQRNDYPARFRNGKGPFKYFIIRGNRNIIVVVCKLALFDILHEDHNFFGKSPVAGILERKGRYGTDGFHFLCREYRLRNTIARKIKKEMTGTRITLTRADPPGIFIGRGRGEVHVDIVAACTGVQVAFSQ